MHMYMGGMVFDIVKEEECHMSLRSEDKNNEKFSVPDTLFSKCNVQLKIQLQGELVHQAPGLHGIYRRGHKSRDCQLKPSVDKESKCRS